MILNDNTAKSYLLQINKKLLSNSQSELRSLANDDAINLYFESIRAVFKEFLCAMMAAKTEEKQKGLILEMCKINSLYSIQLKLGYDLPSDLAEVAYDFDNPDYPGLDYLVDKITNQKYLLQK